MQPENVVFYGTALPREAVICLQQNGFLPTQNSPDPSPAAAQSFTALTAIQGQICAALTHRPLNTRQTELLALYWRAYRDGEPALSVEEASRRLARILELDHGAAANYVRGALRSFGRRLFQKLDHVPLQFGNDKMGDGIAEEIPLLALFAVETGPTGELRHRLTNDGSAAVAAALGMTANGQAASGLQQAGSSSEAPEAMVSLGMKHSSAALLLRVQQALGLSLDDTIRTITAQAGAG